jgi:CrcB protein
MTDPMHLSPSNIGLVMAGGAGGTSLRYLISISTPAWAGVPVVTVAINVAGAFFLGALLETLARRACGSAWSRRLRLGVGTGVLGGFTTYSTLAVDTVELAAIDPGRAAAYALTTVVLGGAATLLGIWVGRGRRSSRDRSSAARSSLATGLGQESKT